MADAFTQQDWQTIRGRLAADPARYGLPERRAGSVVLASFNIRKLGDPDNKSDGAFDLLARFVAQCDIVAVQEILADLRGVQRLQSEAAALAGAPFDLLCSDTTGGVLGGRGMEERLGFLFRPDRVVRGPIAGDISFDRTAVFQRLYDHREDFLVATIGFERSLRTHLEAEIEKLQWQLGRRTAQQPDGVGRPQFHAPHFVCFIRTPHLAAFEIPGADGARPYRITAVNAHLLFGGDAARERLERENEFTALLHWLLDRAASDRSFNQDYVLLGDLNLAFDDRDDRRRTEIVERIKRLNDELAGRNAATVVNFPFIDPRLNPRTGNVETIRSNARLDETFDQIGIFAHDRRLPGFEANPHVADRGDPDAFDYQLFDFVGLFAEALEGAPFGALAKRRQTALIRRFEHDVSDHMPIWIRLPLPR
jgi:Endonuclease/Exonuclease/phosphatase family